MILLERKISLCQTSYLLLQGIFSAIPPNWKLPFKDGENSNNQTNETVSDDDVQDVTRVTSKLIDSTFVKRIQIPPTAQSKFDSLLRSSKNAFMMQSKSTFLEFLRDTRRYKFGPPEKYFSGAKLFRANDVISIEHVLCS